MRFKRCSILHRAILSRLDQRFILFDVNVIPGKWAPWNRSVLSDLPATCKVASSIQNQAFNALLFHFGGLRPRSDPHDVLAPSLPRIFVTCCSRSHRRLRCKCLNLSLYLARQVQQVTAPKASCPHCCRPRTNRKTNLSRAFRQYSARPQDH
jgi:hypothetical protein